MNFILFDIEATCWDGYHSNGIQEIIELGAISIDRYGDSTDSYSQLVKPVINPRLSLYCRNLTGISQKEVATASSFEEVYSDFRDWVIADIDTWFVSWGNFDLKILDDECSRYFDCSSLIINHLDLRQAYASMKNCAPGTALVKALEYEEITFEGTPHRALPDTRNMNRIFSRYFDRWDLQNL